ncbi:MAG: VWA domain-containing protein [Pirellulaceae bacterium]|nr:VWA domain-containing protein [Pirellulaceae bacterium]
MRRLVGLFVLGMLFLGSATSLVYYLILFPAKIPLVAAVALDYRWPLPPNAWTREDLDGLESALGGETLAITEVALQGPSSLNELARQLEASSSRVPRGGAVMVYVSASAAVDGAGEPCLLLPESEPLDSGTWFRLSVLVAHLKSLEQRYSCRHLLILDTHRQGTNWSIGLLDGDFSKRVEDVVRQANATNLVVLNSASPGQRAWTSLHLRGSAFGYWLRFGLAGEADTNGDGRVGCRELAFYLQQQVDRWAQSHRASRQTPLLFPADAADFPLTWTLNPRTRERMRPVGDEAAAESGLISGEKLAWLWEKHDELAKWLPGHFAPHRWQQIEHDLLWLDQAVVAGAGYRDAVERTVGRLEGELTLLLEQAGAMSGWESASPVRRSAVLAADSSLVDAELAVWPSPLAEYVGLPPSAAKDSAGSPLNRLLTRHRANQLWPDGRLIDQVLELSEFATRMSVPRPSQDAVADTRAHRLIRPLLDAPDQVRRTIEDRLFQGGTTTTDIEREVAEVDRQYRQLELQQATLARCYQSRDRAWAALPYLAAWSCGKPHQHARQDAGGPPATEPAANDAAQQVDSLSDLTQQLDRALRQVEQIADQQGISPDALAVLDTLANKTRGQLDALQTLLDDEARRLALPAPASPQLLRDIVELLATPLIPAQLRTPLYSRYVAVASEVDRAVADADADDDADAPNADAAVSVQANDGSKTSGVEFGGVSERSVCPPPRLAAMLLSGDEGRWRAEAQNDLPALGEAMRRALRQTTAAGDTSSAVGDEAVRGDQGTGPDVAADPVERDRRLRRLIALAGASPRDPFQPLRRRALQDLLLWHAQRSLDDFWGVVDADRPVYFATVTRAQLDNVIRLGSPDPPVAREIQRLGELLERRTLAARTGIETLSTDLLLIDELSDLLAQVGIRSTPQTPDLPAGFASAYLRDQLGSLPGTIRPLAVPPGGGSDAASQPMTISLTAQELAGRGPEMQAVIEYRGHEFPTPLTLRQLHGPSIETVRHRYDASRITLAGTERKTASIVFILDCSQSMREAIDIEAPDLAGTPSRSAKLNVAVDALRSLLERFGERGEARIGVRFFGHRVGWRTDQPGTLARRENYPEPIPPTLLPYADVELALPLGRFDSVTAGTVIRRFDALRPWGETPLYLALRQALQDFGPADAQTDRRVVVITDGVNYQFNPSPEMAPSRGDIERAYADQGVRIDLLGFGIPSDEQSTAAREFSALAEATGGSYSVATNASSLIRDLQRQLIRTPFRVLDGETVLGQAELGGTVQIAPGPKHVIEAGQARQSLQLEGGEHLQLGLSRDGQRIVALPYDEGFPRFAPLVAPGAVRDTNYRVGLHRPHRSGDAVVFPVSFQTADGAIPVRPGHVWIEIAPVGRNRSVVGASYVFFDANYKPDLPVPVMHCRCSEWPVEAAQAEVRLWCLPRAIEAAEQVSLTDVADRLPPTDTGFPLKRLSGVTYQVRQFAPEPGHGALRIRVVQRHESGTPVHALKLDLTPPAQHVVRRFDANQGVVLHDFIYALDDLPPADAVALRWQTRDELTAPAWRLDRPISVGVGQQDEVVLPPQILDSAAP